jgi:2-dehydropantoate 2-reductase
MRVAIIGAGALGGYIGAELSVGGAEVFVLGRPGREPRRIRASRFDGSDVVLPHVLTTVSSTEHLRTADVAIVTVKSRDTLEVARVLAEKLRPEVPVLTMQNGLDNPSILASRLGPRVKVGVVTYNVYVDGEGKAVQATRGKVIVERPSKNGKTLLELAWCLERGGARIDLRRDMSGALAGKLLVNLQNGISAATGLCLAELLDDRDARWCFAACVEEGVRVFRAIGTKMARVILVPPTLLPAALRLPDDIVAFAVSKSLRIRRGARSSMLQDIERGVPCEIEELNGAIVRLARSHGIEAPCNEIVRDAVGELEAKSDAALHAPFLTSRELRRRMERSAQGTQLAASMA